MKNLLTCLGLLACSLPGAVGGQTPEPVVHAVLFYSPTCPHCHEVITEHLIPLQNQYQGRLVILGMDTSQGYASDLYWDAIRHFEIPEDGWVVPILVVGGEFLVGGIEIPDRFPAMIVEGLAQGGIDLPDFPTFLTFLREENLLDTRFPNRVIALQDPPVPERGEAPTGDQGEGQDSAVVSEVPAAGPGQPVPQSDTASFPGDSTAGDTLRALEGGQGAPVPALGDTQSTGRSADLGAPTSNAPADSGGLEVGGPDSEARAEVVPPSEPPPGTNPELEDNEPGLPPIEEEVVRVHGEAPVRYEPQGLEDVVRELESMTMWDRFRLDPMGNSLSVVVLLGMILSLVLRGYLPRVKGGVWPNWVIPSLIVVGAFVAAYLSYIELTHSEAVCGPVGDCNAVNQSEYAQLFGVPVGVLGLFGYLVMAVLWGVAALGSANRLMSATIGLWTCALIGTLFSVYLTFLEPFVIGATCAWCLSSAVVMTLLLWATSSSAARVYKADGIGA